jgi:hypothetical protein
MILCVCVSVISLYGRVPVAESIVNAVKRAYMSGLHLSLKCAVRSETCSVFYVGSVSVCIIEDEQT